VPYGPPVPILAKCHVHLTTTANHRIVCILPRLVEYFGNCQSNQPALLGLGRVRVRVRVAQKVQHIITWTFCACATRTEKMTRHRNFCITYNNYPDTSLLDNLVCKYIAYSHEVAPTTGTPHLQGYVSFSNPKTYLNVCALLPGCHISVMVGSIAQNEEYCSKAGTLIERGEKPISNDNKGRAEKLRWQRSRELAKEGKIEEIDADIYIRYYNTLKNIAKDHQKKPEPIDVKCFWIYGPTGTGKSYCVETKYPNCYKKNMEDMKWFDGYQDEEVIYLEDMDKYQPKWGGMLKRLADRWPMQASIKGSMKYIRPKIVIVTSNYRIDEIWSDEGTVDPLIRRFTEVHKLTQDQVVDFDE